MNVPDPVVNHLEPVVAPWPSFWMMRYRQIVQPISSIGAVIRENLKQLLIPVDPRTSSKIISLVQISHRLRDPPISPGEPGRPIKPCKDEHFESLNDRDQEQDLHAGSMESRNLKLQRNQLARGFREARGVGVSFERHSGISELYFKAASATLAPSRSGLISTACVSSAFALAASPRPR